MASAQTPDISREDLIKALQEDELHLVYQPKICLTTDSMIGVEALARWVHPLHGFISPLQFVPLAENNGLIDDLSFWVFNTAARQWAAWAEEGLHTDIAINFSATNLVNIDFPDIAMDIFTKNGVPSSAVTLELTESATQQLVNLLDTLTRLRIKGMHLSIDDFGTGYSSLMQLQQLPFSEMKIDRFFAGQADNSDSCRIISKTIIDLAHNLDLVVTAEGVENGKVEKILRDMGCDRAQGYHFSKPLPAAELAQWAMHRRKPLARTAE